MALNPETFTDKTNKVLSEARNLCLEEAHVQITATHVANVLFTDPEVRLFFEVHHLDRATSPLFSFGMNLSPFDRKLNIMIHFN
jgi:hypothetical protein